MVWDTSRVCLIKPVKQDLSNLISLAVTYFRVSIYLDVDAFGARCYLFVDIDLIDLAIHLQHLPYHLNVV